VSYGIAVVTRLLKCAHNERLHTGEKVGLRVCVCDYKWSHKNLVTSAPNAFELKKNVHPNGYTLAQMQRGRRQNFEIYYFRSIILFAKFFSI